MLHKFVQACAVSSRAILCDGSLQLMYAKVLHAKERLEKLNINVSQPKLVLLVARTQLQAELERDVAGEMVHVMKEHWQPESYVMIAPEIIANDTGIVAYELREHHNEVQKYSIKHNEPTTELRGVGVTLEARRDRFERPEEGGSIQTSTRGDLGLWRTG